MAQAFEGIPRKVVRMSLDNGAHPDCIIGSINAACENCRLIVDDVFGQVYGHLGNSDAILAAILSDLLQERGDEG